MASKENANFYSAAKNNPEVLERRKQRIAQLDADIHRMQSTNPGRLPDWDEERIMRMDKIALDQGKRCILWDDSGTGFYLMLNWDWVRNIPADPPSSEETFSPGWWIHAKHLLKPPLLDPSIAQARLADWIDTHTMKIHHRLLENKHDIKQGSHSSMYILDSNNSYWAQLQSLN